MASTFGSDALAAKGFGERGFTLLEILVGLLVSALIMTGLSMMTRNMNLAWVRTTDTLGNEDAFATSFYVVAGDVARIERMTDRPDGVRQFLFRGSPQEAIYVLAERPAFNLQGLYWVRLFVHVEDGEAGLVRMRAPFESRRQDPASIEWRDPVILLRGQYTIQFAYRITQGGSTSWTSNWTQRDRLPEQIRIEIRDSRTGVLIRPPFVQALKIEAEAACVDSQAGGCTLRSQGQLVAQ